MLPPSLIFAGPAGSGKRQTAGAIAQALNCLEPVLEEGADFEVDACGTCLACTRIARGIHPDVLLVEPGPAGSIRIDQVREIIDRAAYRPFEGRRRAVIIDQADAMQSAAQNALLKTLEEPPPSSVFMLITARPDALLPTVVSRCPRLRFPPLVSEQIDVESREVARRVLAHAAGFDTPRRRIEAAKDLLANTGAGGAADREQLASHLRAMGSLLRDIELLSTRANVNALANPVLRPDLERLTRAFEGERGLRAFTAVDRALVALDRNAGVKIVADWVALNL